MAQVSLEINGSASSLPQDEQAILFACWLGSAALLASFTTAQLKKAATTMGVNLAGKTTESAIIAAIIDFRSNQ